MTNRYNLGDRVILHGWDSSVKILTVSTFSDCSGTTTSYRVEGKDKFNGRMRNFLVDSGEILMLSRPEGEEWVGLRVRPNTGESNCLTHKVVHFSEFEGKQHLIYKIEGVAGYLVGDPINFNPVVNSQESVRPKYKLGEKISFNYNGPTTGLIRCVRTFEAADEKKVTYEVRLPDGHFAGHPFVTINEGNISGYALPEGDEWIGKKVKRKGYQPDGNTRTVVNTFKDDGEEWITYKVDGVRYKPEYYSVRPEDLIVA